MARHARYDRTTALAKAVDLFWQKGYHGSSMKQIEHALDMRPGSIYAAFGSKDGLFSEALLAYTEQAGQELARRIERHDTVLDGLQDYLRGIVADCTEGASEPPAKACMIVKTLLETAHTHPTLSAQANTILARIEQHLCQLLDQAKARGELIPSADPARLARLLQSQIMGLRSMAERDLSPTQLQHLADDMAAILDGYRAHH